MNVSSVNATHAQPETALYCASKGAHPHHDPGVGRGAGHPYGIRVNAVQPGIIVTGLNQDRLGNDDTVRQVVAASALGRLGAADDVAPAIAFLASDEARFITGASLAIHVGWTLSG